MFINAVKIRDFKNLQNINIEPDRNINLFSGGNGHGKTNFAEAIYLLTNRRSFKKSKREDFICYGKDNAVLEAEICEDIKKKIKIVFERKKTILTTEDKSTDFFTNTPQMKSILFNADTLFYFKNFSQYRIRLIDRLCYHFIGKTFLQTYKTYKKTLQNLKKTANTKTNGDVWAKMVKKYSADLNNQRMQFLQSTNEEYKKILDDLKLKDTDLCLQRSDKASVSLTRKDKKDLSLGELKGVILALMASLMRTTDNYKPILIIDDFNSEWDNITRKRSLDILSKTDAQSFLMSTDEIGDYSKFYIEKGEIAAI